MELHSEKEVNDRDPQFKVCDHVKISKIQKYFCLVVCIDDNLLSELLFIEVKMQLMNFLKQFLRSINIAKK